MKYRIEEINGDNRRPEMNPAHTYLVRYRPHPDFGWMGCHTCATLQEAERFAAELTADGEMIEQVIAKAEGRE